MNRRNVLRGAAAVPLAGLGAGAALAAGPRRETTVGALFREWQVADATCRARHGGVDVAMRAEACQRMQEVERQMLETPCEEPRDWCLKVLAWSAYGLMGLPDPMKFPLFWEEAERMAEAEGHM